MHLSTRHEQTSRDVIQWDAYTKGLKAGAIASTITGTGVLTANTYWPAFRNRLGISGKWGLVVSSFLGTFTIVAEKRLLHGAHDPQHYLATMDPTYVDTHVDKDRGLKIYERLANHVYDYPYRTLATVGVPLVGSIFAYQATNHSIARSQQIMHTRIYGQAAVVVLLLASMGFNDYMRQHGRFVTPGEQADEASH